MTEKEIIYLIVAVTILLIIFMLRKQLKRFLFKGGGLEAEVETHDRAGNGPSRTQSSSQGGIHISGNKLKGKKNKINVGYSRANVEENRLKGEGNEINAGPGKPTER